MKVTGRFLVDNNIFPNLKLDLDKEYELNIFYEGRIFNPMTKEWGLVYEQGTTEIPREAEEDKA